jgi:hypothetical protein
MTVPGDLHERLWENAPPRRAELPDGSPVWLVTRYADVRALRPLAVPAEELRWRPSFRARGLATLPVHLG